MGLFASIGSAIGGALTGAFSFLTGGSLLARVAVAGLAVAAQYALGRKKTGQQQQQAPTASATQLETRYGEDLVRTVIFGKVGTAGHHIYRNAYGKGNSIIQDVYVLSHFRINSVPRVRYDAVWYQLGGTEDPAKGFRIQGITAEIWVKVYSGTMAQTADAELISRSNPSGRWTDNHRGDGVAYAIVTSVLNRETLSQTWQPFFEVEGAPLYDWRLDSSVGGSGAHRWADQSTWSFSTNPVLMMYALERGIFNGSELMVGKAISGSNLPLSEWTVAANIADELVTGVKRYQASVIVSSGLGVTHDQNMRPLLEACAGSWLELVGEEYPIVGANQAVVATFTDDDLVSGEAFRFSVKRPRTELVNTVAGTFVDPVSFYNPIPIATRIDATALAADRERLAVSIPYDAVTVSACADRLADIAIRASRFQGNAGFWLRPKYLALKPGQWVTWESAKHGTRTFQIMSKQLGAFGTNNCRNVHVTLQEVADGVFDPTAYATTPPDGIGRGAPEFLAEVQNFTAVANVIIEGTKRYVGIRLTWDLIDDPTVVGVDIEYWPTNQPDVVFKKSVRDDQVLVQLAEGLVSSTEFQIRTRLRTSPGRAIVWTDPDAVTTLNHPFSDVQVYLDAVQEEFREFIKFRKQEHDDLLNELRIQAANIGSANIEDVAERKVIEKSVANSRAKIVEEAILRATADEAFAQQLVLIDAQITQISGDVSANASQITAVNAQINSINGTIAGQALSITQLQSTVTSQGGLISANASAITAVSAVANQASASGLMQWRAIAGAAGTSATFILEGKATVGEAYKFAGAYLEVFPTYSRWRFLADRFIISDGSANGTPFVFENSVLKLAVANIGTITAGLLKSPDGKFQIDLAAGSIVWSD